MDRDNSTLIGILNVLADVTPFPNEAQREDLKTQISSLHPDYVTAPEADPIVRPDESGVVNSDSHDLEGTPHSAPTPVEDPSTEVVSNPGIPNPPQIPPAFQVPETAEEEIAEETNETPSPLAGE